MTHQKVLVINDTERMVLSMFCKYHHDAVRLERYRKDRVVAMVTCDNFEIKVVDMCSMEPTSPFEWKGIFGHCNLVCLCIPLDRRKLQMDPDAISDLKSICKSGRWRTKEILAVVYTLAPERDENDARTTDLSLCIRNQLLDADIDADFVCCDALDDTDLYKQIMGRITPPEIIIPPQSILQKLGSSGWNFLKPLSQKSKSDTNILFNKEL